MSDLRKVITPRPISEVLRLLQQDLESVLHYTPPEVGPKIAGVCLSLAVTADRAEAFEAQLAEWTA